MADMPISLIAWKPMRKNTLLGFATVRIGAALSVKDVSVHTKNGKRWASFPSKPIIDRDGNTQRRDDGRVQYVPVLEWLDRDTADRFSNGVIAAIEREHPGATSAD